MPRNVKNVVEDNGVVSVGSVAATGYGSFASGLSAKNVEYEVLIIERSSAGGAAVEYKNNTGRLGRIGYGSSGEIIMQNTSDVDMVRITPDGDLTAAGIGYFNGSVTVKGTNGVDISQLKLIAASASDGGWRRSEIIMTDSDGNGWNIKSQPHNTAEAWRMDWNGVEQLRLSSTGALSVVGHIYANSGTLVTSSITATGSPINYFRQETTDRGYIQFRNQNSAMRMVCLAGDTELWANDNLILSAKSTGVEVKYSLTISESTGYSILNFGNDTLAQNAYLILYNSNNVTEPNNLAIKNRNGDISIFPSSATDTPSEVARFAWSGITFKKDLTVNGMTNVGALKYGYKEVLFNYTIPADDPYTVYHITNTGGVTITLPSHTSSLGRCIIITSKIGGVSANRNNIVGTFVRQAVWTGTLPLQTVYGERVTLIATADGWYDMARDVNEYGW